MDADVNSTAQADVTRRRDLVLAAHRALSADDRRAAELNGLQPSSIRTCLPEPATTLTPSLTDVLWARRSADDFSPGELHARDLSTLLRLACGPQRSVVLADGSRRRFGMAPSAGGLPSLDVLVVAARVTGVPPGVHRYERRTGALTAVLLGQPSQALSSVLLQPEPARAPAVVGLVARLDRTLGSYPPRHYRQLFADSGVVAQNLYLVATALGLGCRAVAGFHDRAAQQLLGVDEQVGLPSLLVPVGPGA